LVLLRNTFASLLVTAATATRERKQIRPKKPQSSSVLDRVNLLS
jgi:hypothetical protein